MYHTRQNIKRVLAGPILINRICIYFINYNVLYHTHFQNVMKILTERRAQSCYGHWVYNYEN